MATSSLPPFPQPHAAAAAVGIICALLRLCNSSNVDKGDGFRECSRQFDCGLIPNLTYPFWGGDRPRFCGSLAYELECRGSDDPVMNIGGRKFSVLDVNQSPGKRSITLRWLDWNRSWCPTATDFPQSNFPSFTRTSTVNMTVLYNCSSRNPPPNPSLPSFRCLQNGREERQGLFMRMADAGRMEQCDCGEVEVIQVKREAVEGDRGGDLREILSHGFDVNYLAWDSYCEQCERSGGRCGSNTSTSPELFECHCRNGPRQFNCKGDSAERRKKKIAIGIGCGFGGIMLASIVMYIIYRYKKLSGRSVLLSRNISSDPSSMNDSEKGSSFPGVHLFSYTELEQATNHFDPARELGDGGFGTVYYGKLRDGRSVAVKRLYENNYRRVEQFLNEVEILTRLRHKNLVQLYGCTSRHSRELLLVYEFIQNGTVADHLHGQHAKPGGLPWPVRLKIAIETASALAYLHASDIIHRDVKTHNILLDDSFVVKVADFGLSRLFPTDVTHVSTAPQGTPGYVDPEYHQCYQLTDKSDVFSFGVVLIELISSKPAVDITRHRHEINLSNMAINKIQNRALHELVDPQLGFDSDYKVRKMITAVAEMAFQCLQYEKDMRPSMMEVLEALMRIENQDYDKQKAEEMDVSVEEVVLLKNGPPPLSPDSVTVKWNSSSESTASTISS